MKLNQEESKQQMYNIENQLELSSMKEKHINDKI